ncbi:MAG: MerR family transcriptional regulator [Spirochaetaceae bacterium]|nr:MAG: MerR family transcriptional regulator [Spirochaetaceae bacterium]
MLGVHPNTLRWYEAAGYLPPVPRTPGGYRQYSAELIRLARVVRESQHLLRLYGPIRSASSAFLAACKEDCVALQDATREHPDPGTGMAGQERYGRSLHHLSALERLLQDEYRLAMEALAALERFRCGEDAGSPGNERGMAYSLHRRGPLQYIGSAAKLTGLSRDRIINWERNGLAGYPRSAAGYRLFGARELDRLLIIRSCRTAGYSVTAIRRLLHAATAHSSEIPLRTVADTPSPHETELFPVFPTDTLPATLEAMIALTARLRDLLEK